MKSWHEYYKDQNKTEILIKYTFKLPSRVENFNIDDHPLHVKQKDDEIYVNFNKYISISLYEDIKKAWESFCKDRSLPRELLEKNPSQYIVGFIKETLSRINQEILDRKYREGHIILRTISQFDIYDVWIVDNMGKFYKILWPLPIPQFPEVKRAPKNSDVVFVRDLIDAMSEYFYFNLDECVRKIITSLENYFRYYKLSVEKNNGLLSFFSFKKYYKFKALVNKYLTEKYYVVKERDLKILRENILFVYEIRNSIVHNKLRLKLDNLMFCKKAIGTLLYIYQSKFTAEDGKKDYIFLAYDMQFKMIADQILGVNLDNLEKAFKSKRKPEIISNNDELNESMFASLKITKKQKQMAKR